MKMVCGHIQPQNNRPKATVNKATNITPMIMEMTTRWKSWGQNGKPKRLKRRSRTLNSRNWLPLIRINGAENRKASRM